MGFLHKNRYSVSPSWVPLDLSTYDDALFYRAKLPLQVHVLGDDEDTKNSTVAPCSLKNRYPLSLEDEWDVSVATEMGLSFLLHSYGAKFDSNVGQAKKPAAIKKGGLASSCFKESEMAEIFSLCKVDIQFRSLFFRPNLSLCLSNFVKLDLSFNELDSIPESFGFYFPCLKFLSLESNCLSRLPASICALSSVDTLIVDYNKLQYLPESLGALTKLKFFSCKSNQLTFLPDSLLGPLSLLLHLDISENPITFLPPFFLRRKNIKIISKKCPFLTSKALCGFPLVLYDHYFNEKWEHPSEDMQPKNGFTSANFLFENGGIVTRTLFAYIKEYFDLPDAITEQHLLTMCGKFPSSLISYFASNYDSINIFSSNTHPPIYNDSFEIQSNEGGHIFSYLGKKELPHRSKSFDGFFFKIPSLKEFASRAVYARLIDIPGSFPLSLKIFLRKSHPCSYCGGVYFDSWTPRFFCSKLPHYYSEDNDDGEFQKEYVSLAKMCWPHWGDKQSRLENIFSYSKMTQFAPSPVYGFKPFNILDFWIRSASLNNPSIKFDRQRAHTKLWRHLKRTKAFATFEKRFYNVHLCSKAFLLDPYVMCNFLFPVSDSFISKKLNLCKTIEKRRRFFALLCGRRYLSDGKLFSLISL